MSTVVLLSCLGMNLRLKISQGVWKAVCYAVHDYNKPLQTLEYSIPQIFIHKCTFLTHRSYKSSYQQNPAEDETYHFFFFYIFFSTIYIRSYTCLFSWHQASRLFLRSLQKLTLVLHHLLLKHEQFNCLL